MYQLATELFPICRSITGDGTRETLRILQRELPEMQISEIPTGTRCFDWVIPKEWNIRDAYVIDPDGRKIVDFKHSNIHVVNYSTPVDMVVSFEELDAHLYSLPDQPDAVPYVTSYYRDRWGFCIAHDQRVALRPGDYRVFIDSDLEDGSLSLADMLIRGRTDQEILLSTFICHPSMANNEVSGMVVTTELAKWVRSLEGRTRYSYRFVFVPETIGSIAYLSRHSDALKKKVIAGFIVSCVGDDRCYSYMPSRDGNTLSDRAAVHALRHIAPDFRRYTFLDRGSDERQYCSPGVDLPIATICRSKYAEYPEYHTSKDDLGLISENGLKGAFTALRRAIECIERNECLRMTVLGEPQLEAHGLYPGSAGDESEIDARTLLDLMAYCDGTRDLLEIAEIIDAPMWHLFRSVDKLKAAGLVEGVPPHMARMASPRTIFPNSLQ